VRNQIFSRGRQYLVKEFEDIPLRTIGLFELQKLLNGLAEKYSESIVKHAFVNVRSIMKLAQKLKFVSEKPRRGNEDAGHQACRAAHDDVSADQ
jgi:hypothetical protein